MARRKGQKVTSPEYQEFIAKVGEIMKELRLQRGYKSYEQFAYQHDIGRAQYGKYERGTEDLRLSSLFKILASLEISFSEFFELLEKKK